MVEYALIVAIISIAAITALTLLGGNVGTFFSAASDAVGGATTGDQTSG